MTCRLRTATLAFAALAALVSACGSASHADYSAEEVQEALRAAGVESHVVFGPKTSTASSGALDSPQVEGSMFKTLMSGQHIVALVAGPQRVQPNGGQYDVVAKVFGTTTAAERSAPREGVAKGCFGLMLGRRGNVVLSAAQRYMPRVRDALGKLSKPESVPVLRLKLHCVTK